MKSIPSWFSRRPLVSEIWSHLEPAEKAAMYFLSGGYGIWTAATLVGPIMFVLTLKSLNALIVALPIVAIHVFCAPYFLRYFNEELCGSKWAKAQGITSETLNGPPSRK